jgi:hypothetical protein
MNNIDLIAVIMLSGIIAAIAASYLYWNWKLNKVYNVPEWVYNELLKKVEKHLYEQEEWDFKVEESVEWGKSVLWVDIKIQREFIEDGKDYDDKMTYRELPRYREAFVVHEFYYDGVEKPCDFDEDKFELYIENY